MLELVKAGQAPTLEILGCKLDVHRDTLHEWAKVHPEFSDAIKMVKQHQEAAMQVIGLQGITGKTKGFAQGAWAFWMKARFNWDEAGQLDYDEVEPIFD